MRLSLGTKILGGFGAVVTLMIGTGVYALSSLGTTDRLLDDLYQNQTLGITVVLKANNALFARGRAEKNLILASDPAEIARHAASMLRWDQELSARLAEFKPFLRTEQGHRLMAELERDHRELQAMQAQIALAAKLNHDSLAMGEALKGRAIADRMDRNIDDLVAQKMHQAAEKRESADSLYRQARVSLLAVMGAGIALALGIGLFLATRISRVLKGLRAAAQDIARGKLSMPALPRSDDETGDLVDAFQRMVSSLREVADLAGAVGRGDLSHRLVAKGPEDQFSQAMSSMVESLRTVIAQVRRGAETVAAAASQGSASAAQSAATMHDMESRLELVAHNADALASAVAQSSASIEQMTATIHQVSNHAAAVNEAAADATRTAQVGKDEVGRTLTGLGRIREATQEAIAVMGRLDDSSQRIGEILALIEEIADQTNLLALNAAIEAARAGEHGRGFAVVADEVRQLAERSARATQEIGVLVQGIQKEASQAIASTRRGGDAVAEGVQIAEKAGMALNTIVSAIERASSLATQIARATQEQRGAADQIVTAVDSMGHMTRQVSDAATAQAASGQQMSAAIEQISAMSQELNGQADQLVEAVNFFTQGEPRDRAEADRLLPAPDRERPTMERQLALC